MKFVKLVDAENSTSICQKSGRSLHCSLHMDKPVSDIVAKVFSEFSTEA